MSNDNDFDEALTAMSLPANSQPDGENSLPTLPLRPRTTVELISLLMDVKATVNRRVADLRQAERYADERRNQLSAIVMRAEQIVNEVNRCLLGTKADITIDDQPQFNSTLEKTDDDDGTSQNLIDQSLVDTLEFIDVENVSQLSAVTNDNESTNPVRENKTQEDEIDDVSDNEGSQVLETKDQNWLLEVRPMKLPYVPQIDDIIVYFKQGYKEYLKDVENNKLYVIDESLDRPETKTEIRNHEFVRVKEMSYDTPPQGLCSLTLERVANSDSPITGSFKIRYLVNRGVVDFMILRKMYDASLEKQWHEGDKFRCAINGEWHFGKIMSIADLSLQDGRPEPLFNNLCIRWNENRQLHRISQWRIEPVDEKRLPKDPRETVTVLFNEIRDRVSQTDSSEWPSGGPKNVCKVIARNLDLLGQQLYSRPFFNLRTVPSYLNEMAYPIDLTIIKYRLNNFYYRRMSALNFDLDCFKSNVERINQNNVNLRGCSKNNYYDELSLSSKLINAMLEKFIRCPTELDIEELYNEYEHLQDTQGHVAESQDDYVPESMDSEDFVEDLEPHNSRDVSSPCMWYSKCTRLLKDLLDDKDSKPFREPVNDEHYRKEISVPMSLNEVMESHRAKLYDNPKKLDDDAKLIFENSKKYNANKTSVIYKQTEKLEKIYKSRMEEIITQWKESKTKKSPTKELKKSPDTVKRSRNVTEDLEKNGSESSSKKQKSNVDVNEPGPSGMQKKHGTKFSSAYFKNQDTSSEENDDDDDDETSIGCQKKNSPKKNCIVEEDDDDDDKDSVMSSSSYDPFFIDDSNVDESPGSSDNEYSDPEDKGVDQNDKEKRKETSDKKKSPSKGSSNCKTPTKRIVVKRPLPPFTPLINLRLIKPRQTHILITGRVINPISEPKFVSAKNKLVNFFKFQLECANGAKVIVKAWGDQADIYENKIRHKQVIRTIGLIATLPFEPSPDVIQEYDLEIRNYTDIIIISRNGNERKISKKKK